MKNDFSFFHTPFANYIVIATVILKPKIHIILGEISMVYHMAPLVLKAVIIGVIPIDKPNQDIKFIRIHFFYNAAVIPFLKMGDDTVERCIPFLQQLYQFKYKYIFLLVFMHIFRSLGRKIKAKTIPCIRKADAA